MGKLVGNEQAKLTATYLNGVAIAVFAVGGIAPITNFTGSADASGDLLGSLLVLAGCAILSGALHYIARNVLQRLEE